MAETFTSRELRDLTAKACVSYMDEIEATIHHGIDNTPVPAGQQFIIERVLGRYDVYFHTLNDDTAECYLYIAGLKREDKPIQYGGMCAFKQAESVNDAYTIAFFSALAGLFEKDENAAIAESEQADAGPEANKDKGTRAHILSIVLDEITDGTTFSSISSAQPVVTVDYDEGDDTFWIVTRYEPRPGKPESYSVSGNIADDIVSAIQHMLKETEAHIVKRIEKEQNHGA